MEQSAGQLISNRYRLLAPEPAQGLAERWHARDDLLDRDVSILLLESDGDITEAALDAARRSASLDNPRLVRILDLGRDPGCAFIVDEYFPHQASLAHVLTAGPLPPPETRRITGEIATLLDTSGQRGLHHQALSPEVIFRTSEGDVRVRGLAVHAALAGLDETPTQEAVRADAVGIVALLYAMLTGRWPLPVGGGALPPALRTASGVMAPSEVAAAVPGDLDAMCRLTLVGDQGPTSPRDVARQIAPWSPVPVIAGDDLRASSDTGAPTIGFAINAAPAMSLPEAPIVHTPTSSHDSLAEPSEGPSEIPQSVSVGEKAAGASAAIGATVAGLGRRLRGFGQRGMPQPEGAPAAASPAPQPEPVVAAEPATRPQPVAAAPGVPRPAPLMPESTAIPLNRDQSRLALAIVAAFVVISLAFGLYGASRIGKSDTATAPTSSTKTSTATASPSTTLAPVAPEPLAITAITSFDPMADGKENDDLLPLAIDADPATMWKSEGYRTAEFSGLKTGVGVAVDLGSARDVRAIRMTLDSPSSFEIYVGDQPTHDGTPVASQSAASGDLELALPTPAKGRFVTVWFTSVSKVDKWYRATISELAILG